MVPMNGFPGYFKQFCEVLEMHLDIEILKYMNHASLKLHTNLNSIKVKTC